MEHQMDSQPASEGFPGERASPYPTAMGVDIRNKLKAHPIRLGSSEAGNQGCPQRTVRSTKTLDNSIHIQGLKACTEVKSVISNTTFTREIRIGEKNDLHTRKRRDSCELL
jgi:hypothetical protein